MFQVTLEQLETNFWIYNQNPEIPTLSSLQKRVSWLSNQIVTLGEHGANVMELKRLLFWGFRFLSPTFFFLD